MSKKHHVKTHSWVGGILHTVEHFFNSLEEAMSHAIDQTTNHANNSDAHNIKIYNEHNELVHHVTTQPKTSTYA